MRTARLLVLLSLASMAAACGSESGDDNVTMTGTVRLSGDSTLLADAEICVENRPEIPCVQTGPDGRYTLPGLRAGDEALLRITHEVLWTFYLHRTVNPAETALAHELFDLDLRDGVSTLAELAIGVPYSAEQGFLWLLAKSPGAAGQGGGTRAGVSFALSTTEGTGPHYAATSGLLDTRLTATEEVGIAVFYNVPPGEYTVTSSYPGGECTLSSSWSAGAPETWRVVSKPDSWTYMSVNCSQP